ncbi:phosphatase domain-containing protein [uncultured Dokdonia sp.]|uniref:App1 family protein n=1 Tax=uncultured Dokdonia sp. TaxID=575653 RepID=UPI00260F5C56|nr:phosphatase domain-containing protein [uncultured Dokdonia sp.]
MFFSSKSDPIQIDGYQSYGSSNHLYLIGRALEHEGVDLKKTSFLSALKNAYKQFASDELRHTKLKVTLLDNRSFYTTTDAEGYFKIDEKVDGLGALANDEGWLQMVISFDDVQKGITVLGDNRFPIEMLIPAETASYGVISDIDDTILHTGVASLLKWRVIINTFFKNVGKRTSLEGAPELYRKLHGGKSGQDANPMFYVSNSPWNLYSYLESFVRNQKFPKGPILLRDLRSPLEKTPKPEKPHKQHEIRNILNAYPKLKFVLIGDSGEHDVDIYLEVAKEYPEQIIAVYLRSVKHKKKVLRVKSVLSQYETTPAVLVEKSSFAEEHARSIGLIS